MDKTEENYLYIMEIDEKTDECIQAFKINKIDDNNTSVTHFTEGFWDKKYKDLDF